MKRIENLYLVRLIRQNKSLFVFVFAFIFFQQYFYLKDNSTFPWFVWSMYSHEEYVPETVTQTELFIDNKRLDISAIPIWQEATVMHTFNKYMQLKNNNYNDPIKEVVKNRTGNFSPAMQQYIASQIENKKENADKYPEWLKQYLETSIVNQTINTIEFKEVKYTYNNYIFTRVDSSKTLLKIDN